MIQVLSLKFIDEEDLKRLDQQDVTKIPRGKVEIWLCNEVQESIKIVMTQCIDDLWVATLRKFRRTKLRKKSMGAKQVRWIRVDAEWQ